MATFRFRAAAALERRREDETQALADLARVQARFHEASTSVEAEVARRARAEADAAVVQRRGCDAETLLWHRNWILRLASAVERLRQERDACAADVERARAAWMEARRRRLALERMKERAWRRFQLAEQRQTAKELDELARLRFVASDQWRHDP
ncbi:MAG: flagellar export protein FliJ [Acidobacteria bacterium]|nr:flagellar export protein FliJ [Acidobacteriota bacterium]